MKEGKFILWELIFYLSIEFSIKFFVLIWKNSNEFKFKLKTINININLFIYNYEYKYLIKPSLVY